MESGSTSGEGEPAFSAQPIVKGLGSLHGFTIRTTDESESVAAEMTYKWGLFNSANGKLMIQNPLRIYEIKKARWNSKWTLKSDIDGTVIEAWTMPSFRNNRGLTTVKKGSDVYEMMRPSSLMTKCDKCFLVNRLSNEEARVLNKKCEKRGTTVGAITRQQENPWWGAPNGNVKEVYELAFDEEEEVLLQMFCFWLACYKFTLEDINGVDAFPSIADMVGYGK